MRRLLIVIPAILCVFLALLFFCVEVGSGRIGAVIVSDTFWVSIGSVGALITLIFIYDQTRTTRMVYAADFLLKLWGSFYSDDMRERRIELAKIIKEFPGDNKKLASSSLEVLDFFENIGLLVKRAVIPLEYIWSGYYYWIVYYWIAVKEYVSWFRKEEKDPTYYDSFEYLFRRVIDFDERRRHKKVEIGPESLREFIENEINLG
jgi:hypothetical protein